MRCNFSLPITLPTQVLTKQVQRVVAAIGNLSANKGSPGIIVSTVAIILHSKQHYKHFEKIAAADKKKHFLSIWLTC